MERGSFQVWNMNFWNFYEGPNGEFDVLLHSKYWNKRDTTDPYSFLIVAERLSSPEFRKYPRVFQTSFFFISASLLFWDNRQKRHHCFQENMMRGGRFEDGEDPIQVGKFIDPQANHFFRQWLRHRAGTTEHPKTSSKSSSTRARSSESATDFSNLIFPVK